MMRRQPNSEDIHATGQRNQRIICDPQQNQARSTQAVQPPHEGHREQGLDMMQHWNC